MSWLDYYLKNTVSEHPLRVNMLKGTKLLQKLNQSTFIIFFITLRQLTLEYASLSDMLNLMVAW